MRGRCDDLQGLFGFQPPMILRPQVLLLGVGWVIQVLLLPRAPRAEVQASAWTRWFMLPRGSLPLWLVAWHPKLGLQGEVSRQNPEEVLSRGGGREGAEGGLTSASGRWMDWMVLRSCSRRAISSLCSAAVAMASVTWACSSAQRPVAKGRRAHQREPGGTGGAFSPPLPLQPPILSGSPGSCSSVLAMPSPPSIA